MKITSGKSAPIGPASSKPPPSKDQKGDLEDPKGLKKPPQAPPTRKIMYTSDDVKSGDMVIAHLPSNTRRCLGEVRRV